MKTKKPVTRQSAPELQDAYSRVPADPRRRLEWVVDLVGNVGRMPKDEDDSRKQRAEMYSFLAAAGLAPIEPSEGPLWGDRVDAILNPRPENLGYVRRFHNATLKTWQQMIQCALNREPVSVVRGGSDTVLIWSPTGKRFVEETRYLQEYQVAAARALGKLLVDYGHLVKECPAPKLRGQPGETCETWFVASRPNKLYCSSACQSRATTAGYRAGKRKSKGKKKRKPTQKLNARPLRRPLAKKKPYAQAGRPWHGSVVD